MEILCQRVHFTENLIGSLEYPFKQTFPKNRSTSMENKTEMFDGKART